MLGEEDKDRLSGINRKNYLRSVSWTDRSPSKPNPNPRPTPNTKPRFCLPPLQPLSIARRPVEEWPRAGSDDLGVWPNPQTPRVPPAKLIDGSDSDKPVREFMFKRDKLAFFDKECSRIADHVYLGSDAVAKNREVLRQNGITHVLNCVGFVCPEYFKGDILYKTLWLQDSPSEDITSILYDVFDYFEDVREQHGRVLVHCFQGVSRSTSLVIAYLMWREGQSFEDAFQYVKAARGVTNPNMGFACQLLQCQKRVHAMPASPNSVLRMYRMAPHSSYDPLHLVPKMLNNPSAERLDSRGAFIVHVPFALYVWVGKDCNSAMSNNARVAANQVLRYERAQGPILNVNEGEEVSEFWDVFVNGQMKPEDGGLSPAEVGERRIDEYDLDFEIFHKALSGGVVPPLAVSNTGSETCLPARENGWGKVREKFANGVIKELLSSKPTVETSSSTDGLVDTIVLPNVADTTVNTVEEPENLSPVGYPSPSSPSSHSTDDFGSPDSFETFPNSKEVDSPSMPLSPDSFDIFVDSIPDRISSSCKEVEPGSDPLSPSLPRCGSLDSFSCFPDSNIGTKSPTLSPSTSDYASSFTFSPSSSNWSDLSYLSSRQPSPASGVEAVDLFSGKKCCSSDNSSSSCLLDKDASDLPNVCLSNKVERRANSCLQNTRNAPSIAERRGSIPPPRMLLSSVDEASSQVPKTLVRSCSFSLTDVDDDDDDESMNNLDGNQNDLLSEVNSKNEYEYDEFSQSSPLAYQHEPTYS